MTNLTYLEHLSEVEYELERNRLVDEAIRDTPSMYHESLRLQQCLIDSVPRADRVKQIVACLSEALENLGDQIQAFKNSQR